MQTVMFSVGNVDRIQEVIRVVRKVFKSNAVEPLYPGSHLAERKREFFLTIDDQFDLNDAARKLSDVPGVVEVDVPVSRKLIA